MTSQVRVIKWLVQPVAVADDGENLTELQLNPVAVPASQWESWTAGGWRDSLAALRAQVEGPPAPAGPQGPEPGGS